MHLDQLAVLRIVPNMLVNDGLDEVIGELRRESKRNKLATRRTNRDALARHMPLPNREDK